MDATDTMDKEEEKVRTLNTQAGEALTNIVTGFENDNLLGAKGCNTLTQSIEPTTQKTLRKL